MATRIVESLVEQGYRFCLIDPEGGLLEPGGADALRRSPEGPPVATEIIAALNRPQETRSSRSPGCRLPISSVLRFASVSAPRPAGADPGHPHWLLLDEAHHLMPADWKRPEGLLPERLVSFLLITVHPELLRPVGAEADRHVDRGGEAAATGNPRPVRPGLEARVAASGRIIPRPGDVLLWEHADRARRRGRSGIKPGKTERRRHRRKYAENDFPRIRSFYFTGPEKPDAGSGLRT